MRGEKRNRNGLPPQQTMEYALPAGYNASEYIRRPPDDAKDPDEDLSLETASFLGGNFVRKFGMAVAAPFSRNNPGSQEFEDLNSVSHMGVFRTHDCCYETNCVVNTHRWFLGSSNHGAGDVNLVAEQKAACLSDCSPCSDFQKSSYALKTTDGQSYLKIEQDCNWSCCFPILCGCSARDGMVNVRIMDVRNGARQQIGTLRKAPRCLCNGSPFHLKLKVHNEEFDLTSGCCWSSFFEIRRRGVTEPVAYMGGSYRTWPSSYGVTFVDKTLDSTAKAAMIAALLPLHQLFGDITASYFGTTFFCCYIGGCDFLCCPCFACAKCLCSGNSSCLEKPCAPKQPCCRFVSVFPEQHAGCLSTSTVCCTASMKGIATGDVCRTRQGDCLMSLCIPCDIPCDNPFNSCRSCHLPSCNPCSILSACGDSSCDIC